MARLPILMYHNVTESDNRSSKGLSISVERLENHFRYLAEKGYSCFHLNELENKKSLPPKSIVITFDDVTENQLLAVQLLEKYNLKATFFIPFGYVGKTDEWNLGNEKIMTYEQLSKLPENIELGMHSYEHKKYNLLNENEINQDFAKCFEQIASNRLTVLPYLAYPYGKYPKKEPMKSEFQKVLSKNGIKYGLRIGNALNQFPFKNPYEIKRIDIKGEDTLLKFRLKLKFGKLKLF